MADHPSPSGLANRACIGSLPRAGELIAVEKPEHAPDYEQDEFVKRPRNRQKRQRAAPPKRPGNAPVANHNLDRAERPEDKGSCGSHAVSLGPGLRSSRSPSDHASETARTAVCPHK